MYRDVTELHDFYRDRLGLVVQRLLRRRLRQMWPDLTGQTLMGFGYAAPLLKAYEEQTAHRFLVMPAAQGVMAGPKPAKAARSRWRTSMSCPLRTPRLTGSSCATPWNAQPSLIR